VCNVTTRASANGLQSHRSFTLLPNPRLRPAGACVLMEGGSVPLARHALRTTLMRWPRGRAAGEAQRVRQHT
jgi:hypothetical protein